MRLSNTGCVHGVRDAQRSQMEFKEDDEMCTGREGRGERGEGRGERREEREREEREERREKEKRERDALASAKRRGSEERERGERKRRIGKCLGPHAKCHVSASRTWTLQQNIGTLPRLSSPSKDAGG
ncbi:hypothetical protein HanRHA438_Chr14g0673961 [Helianthus annuus]|nr:hypothetical protein HanRHA438_Chr14g0673961 [Helianthus annuus]